jgi:hypothetical protein
MTENWEDIIKNKLQHDAVTPPPSAWEAINDSSWTQKIKSKSEQASHPQVPKKLTHKVFQHAQIQPYFGGIGIKAAALIIGIAGSAIGLYYATQTYNNQLDKGNTIAQTEAIVNPINPQATNPKLQILSSEPETLKPQIEAPKTPTQTLKPQSSNFRAQSPNLISQSPNLKLPTLNAQSQNPSLQNLTLEPQSQTPSENFSTKNLTAIEIQPLTLTETNFSVSRKTPRKTSHLKPQLDLHAGIQQRLNKRKYTNSKERSTYQHWPIQREQGLIVGLTLNHKWILETGIFNASAKSNLTLNKLPYYKTPIKINPQRKTIEINTPHHQRTINAHGVALLPNGANWRDTSKYYAISFEENHHAQFIEIPLSMGYKHTWHRFLFSAQLGGMLLLPQKVQTDFRLTINNAENTTFEFQQDKTIKNNILYQGFAQMQVGYYLIPQLNTYINVLLPGLHENNPNATVSVQNLRFQVGLNYNF